MHAFNGVESSKRSKRIDPSPPPTLDEPIMCFSTTRIFYGIIVKSWSLYIASLAFQNLIPVSLEIDDIMMRCRDGATVSEDVTRSNELPVEIWEMIWKEVIALEIIAVETRQMARFCPPCEPDCNCGLCPDRLLEARGKGALNFYECGEWHNAIEDEEYEQAAGFDRRLNTMTMLLDAFGLECFHDWMLSKTNMRTPLYSIALKSTAIMESPLHPSCDDFDRTKYSLEINHDQSDDVANVSAAVIDSSIFTSIDYDDALSRFKRLVKDYQLDLEDTTSGEYPTVTCHSPDAISIDPEAEEERKKEAIRKLEKHVVQPRWMLSSSICTICGEVD